MYRSQNSSHQIQHIVCHKNSSVLKRCFVRRFHTDLCNCILPHCSPEEDEFFHPILSLNSMKVFKHNNSSTGVAIGYRLVILNNYISCAKIPYNDANHFSNKQSKSADSSRFRLPKGNHAMIKIIYIHDIHRTCQIPPEIR